MCMEDIRIGRRAGTNTGGTPVTNASTQILAANPFRVAITLSAPATGRLSVTFGGPAADGLGIVIPANVDPVKLDIRYFGTMLTQQVNGFLSLAGPETIGFVETVLSDQ